MAGTALMHKILLKLSAAGVTVWRNNTGSGWAGRSFELRAGQHYTAKGGERVVLDARPLRAGLCEGSSDMIGFESVTITPEMVGSRIAVFGAWESKENTGRATSKQANFVDLVLNAGGIGGIVRSETEALATLKEK